MSYAIIKQLLKPKIIDKLAHLTDITMHSLSACIADDLYKKAYVIAIKYS